MKNRENTQSNCYWIIGIILLWASFWVTPRSEAFESSQLKMKDLDQMTALVASQIALHQNGEGGVKALREGLRIIFSRPDGDGMIEKVIGPLRTVLDEEDAWNSQWKELVEESLALLKNSEKYSAEQQMTHWVFLENFLSEMKPQFKKAGPFRDLAEKIQKAEILLSGEARAERALKLMDSKVSPSQLAQRILEKMPLPSESKKRVKKEKDPKGPSSRN